MLISHGSYVLIKFLHFHSFMFELSTTTKQAENYTEESNRGRDLLSCSMCGALDEAREAL